jgi:hypothetical protein
MFDRKTPRFVTFWDILRHDAFDEVAFRQIALKALTWTFVDSLRLNSYA